jgi:hypothetical protein
VLFRLTSHLLARLLGHLLAGREEQRRLVCLGHEAAAVRRRELPRHQGVSSEEWHHGDGEIGKLALVSVGMLVLLDCLIRHESSGMDCLNKNLLLR